MTIAGLPILTNYYPELEARLHSPGPYCKCKPTFTRTGTRTADVRHNQLRGSM